MAEIKLSTETGRSLGSRPARRLRGEGKVPGVVYGQGADPVSVAVEWKPFRAALTGEAGLNALLNLDIDGDVKLAIVKDLQRHPVTGTVQHIDFLLINRNESISVDVPVQVVGEAKAVLNEGGLVEHNLTSLTVNAKPADIPNELTVDVSDLVMGHVIRVGDIELPSGVTTDVDPDEPVVITSIASPVEDETAEGETAEGEEGEEGEAAGEDGAEASAAEGDGEG